MYYRQPRYYKDFRCIGSDCLDNCCFGWRIDWKKDEVEKLKNAENMSPKLKALAETSFVENLALEGHYRINIGIEGACPFQTEEKLCLIQKELGAEYLSRVCTTYPRYSFTAGEAVYCCCHASCPVIVKALLDNPSAMDLVNLPMEQGTQIPAPNKKAERQHFGELIDFFYELISDKRIPVETAIILGALAAQKLTELAVREQYDMFPEALKAFRKQFHNAAQLKSIEDIKPNYYLKFAFLTEIVEKILVNGVTAILRDNTGTLNIDLYNRGERGMHEILAGREYFLRSLALDLLLDLSVPFKFKEKSIFENYSLFAVAFGCLKLELIALCSTEKNICFKTNGQSFDYTGDDKLVGMTAMILRGLCQSNEKQEQIIDRLKENKFTTPAYLALLVK